MGAWRRPTSQNLEKEYLKEVIINFKYYEEVEPTEDLE